VFERNEGDSRLCRSSAGDSTTRGNSLRLTVGRALEDSATEPVSFIMARMSLLLLRSTHPLVSPIVLRHRMRVQQGSLRMWPASVPIKLSAIALDG
jgi:hypothetical protein